MIRKIIPPGAESNARDVVSLLREHKFEQIEKNLDPSIIYPSTDDTLAQMEALFPATVPISTKVVGVNRFQNSGVSTTSISLEYEFPGKWLLASVVTRSSAEGTLITGLTVKPLSDSLENQNRFSLKDKGGLQYAALALAVFAPLLCIYAFVLCIRTKIEKRKWLWLIITLIGVGTLNLNWTTGQSSFALFNVYLLSAGINAAPYGPWILHISLPLGALLFLGLRNKLEKPAHQPMEPPNPLPSTPQSPQPTPE